MGKKKPKLLAGYASTLWDNGGSVATSVPKQVREMLGLEPGDHVSWIGVGLETVFVRLIGGRIGRIPEGYRRSLESQEWAIRIGAVSSMQFPAVNREPECCAICHVGRAIAVVVPLAFCTECDAAMDAVMAQKGIIVQEGLDLEAAPGGSGGDADAGDGAASNAGEAVGVGSGVRAASGKDVPGTGGGADVPGGGEEDESGR